MSLLFLAALPLLAQPVPYRDPQGRFSIQAPAGWTAAALNNDAVNFSAGSGYLTLMVMSGDNPQAAIDSVSRQTGAQWRNFAEARRGEVRMAGRSGSYVTYSGTSPRGADSYLQIMAVADRGSVYVLMAAAPKTDYARLSPGFEQIEQSLTISAHAVAPVAPTPAPAPAPPVAPQAKATGKPTYYRMKKASVIDEHGFERPMPALSLLIPKDWQFQGDTKYQATFGGCHENTVQVSFRASSPDQRLALEMFPDYVWQWANDPGTVQLLQSSARQFGQFGGKPCDVMPGMTAADYLRRVIIPRARPRAQIAAVEPLPEVLQQAEAQARQYEQTAARMGMRMSIRADAGRVRLQYSLDGQPVEEWLTALTYAAGVPGPSYNIQTGQMGQTLYYSNGAYMVMAMRAPQGQLTANERFFDMIRATVHAEPQWMARVQQSIQGMQAADTKGAADRSRIIAQSGREISDMINKGYEERSRAHDRAVEKFDQYIRGVGTYRNPQTGETFELPYYYNHAWVNGSGTEYVVSDSGFFNPNSALGGNWTEVVPVK
jgi:hypothetical protein